MKQDRRTFLKKATTLAAGSSAAMVLPVRAFATQETVPPNAPTWTATTQAAPWQLQPLRPAGWRWDTLDVTVSLETEQPAGQSAIRGFGACFNELGWTSLQKLTPTDRASVFEEMFAPGKGANFTICRMPVGANDFSRGWYSYDETSDDFSLQHFSIANDLETLVPFIKSAQRYNPALKLWASPWSPPSWMKRNKFYAEADQFPGWLPNGIRPDQVGKEGTDMFIQKPRFFEAYAEYFGKFIDAYKQQGIEVGMVMPQNEFNSAQAFPSCTWTPEGLAQFIRRLGPVMAKRNVEVFFGTLERGNKDLLSHVLADPEAGRWIKGVGLQWAGKTALAAIHKEHPALTIYQSEQECGDGKNDWSYAAYCWNLMKHYLSDGATGYMYWNISLLPGGASHWGWPQNSLITVKPDGSYQFNHEHYVLKHVSHFVQPGAKRLTTDGTCDDVLAFLNPDRSVAVILRNESSLERPVDVTIGDMKVPGTMQADSFNTLLIKHWA
ncbi:glycoside hydrolase family 30 protein [Granulicella arctica]|uniref:glycoside hydrolase family 30 protein n=1 Tax=Granulicella arctica TaxID=940613 RepID=UPI0021E09BFC|nr:glycoside hydrolase family 30 protein [Granulicella arctica]